MKPILRKKIIWKTVTFNIQTSDVFLIRTWDESFTFFHDDGRHVWGKSTAECRSPERKAVWQMSVLPKLNPFVNLIHQSHA